MRILLWALRLFIFFTLFAFALNNEQPVVVHWFFGAQWTAPMVIVVLAAFAGGAALGVLAMVPAWRTTPDTVAPPASEFGPEHPPREGL